MERMQVEAVERNERGKNAMHRLRAQGWLPGVVYGSGSEAVPVAVAEKSLRALLARGDVNLVDLTIKGAKGAKTVLVKELQRHPVTDKPLHIDFLEVSMKQEIELKVPVRIQGTAAGQALGGIVAHLLRDLTVRCLPSAIPDHLVANVESLNIGHSLHVRDLALPEGVKAVTPADEVVVTVSPPTELKETVAAAGAEAAAPAEPEVIGEKEREERRKAAEAGKEEKGKEKEAAKKEAK